MEIVENKQCCFPDTESRNEVENRNYKLNERKAMEKKKTASYAGMFSIIETGGGIKIEFNAGLYELLKSATERYFSLELNTDKKNKKILVTDKSGNFIETKYKVFSGKFHYTLNMYHTQCSCLINGKNTHLFLGTDLPNILNSIESLLAENNCSVSDMNKMIRNMVECYEQQCKENNSNSTDSSEAQKLIIAEACDEETEVTFKKTVFESFSVSDTNLVHEISSNACRSTVNSVDENSPETDSDPKLQAMHEDILLLKDILLQHIQTTNNQFSCLKDEIMSMKNQCILNRKLNESNFDTIAKKTDETQMDIKNFTDLLQRKVQSIFDTVKLKLVHAESSKKETTATCTNCTSTQVSMPNTASGAKQDIAASPNKGPASQSPKKSLIIGDSILKGVHRKGLFDSVDVNTIRGARSQHIRSNLSGAKTDSYSKIVLHYGGNDVADGKSLQTLRQEMREIVTSLQQRQCTVYLCTLCPRLDVDVSTVNDMIRELCADTSAICIDNYPSFILGNGSVVKNNFHRDGIHLNNQGTRTLLSNINSTVAIYRARRTLDADNQFQPRRSSQHFRQSGYQGYRFQRHMHRPQYMYHYDEF